jgi:hypothetical protein
VAQALSPANRFFHSFSRSRFGNILKFPALNFRLSQT